jgi:hypothetical protein
MPLGEEDVVLFAGGRDGGGYSVNPGLDVYHWTMNWDDRPNGRSVPALAPTRIAATILSEVTTAFEWEKATDKEAFLLFTHGTGAAALVGKLENNTVTVNDGSITATAPFTDGILYRTDGATVNDEVAYFCNGSSAEAMMQRVKNGTYSTDGHSAKADVLGIVNDQLWKADGYEISILTLDADPGVDSNWGAKIPVGLPTWPVNKIIPLGGTGIVITGLGVYRYNPNPSSARFEPIIKFDTPHADNGKHAFTDGRGRVYCDTIDGHILVITFGFMNSQTPTRFTWIDRDTPWGPISAFAADVDHIYAAIRPGNTRTQQLSLYVQSHETGGNTWVNETSAVTDQSYATAFDASDTSGNHATALSTGDELYVGASEPFWGIWFDILARRTPLGSAVTIEVSNGSGGWTAVTSTSRDSTHVFMRTGLMGINKGTADLFADGTWKPDTVNSVSGRYWVRITFQSAMTALKIREIAIVPYRPPIDPDTFPLSGAAIAGALPKILVGTWRGERILWHDVWTLDAAEVEQMVIGRTTSTNSVGDRTLYCFTGDGVHYVPVGPEADPSRAPWPRLADYNDSTVSQDEHIIAFSGHNFGMPHVPKRVTGDIVIDMRHVQEDDEVWFVYKWNEDSERYYRKGPLAQDALVLNGLEGQGEVLYGYLMYKDGSRDAIAPALASVTIPKGAWETLEPDDRIGAEDTASPVNV